MTEVSCKSEPLKRRTVPEALRIVNDSGAEVFQKNIGLLGCRKKSAFADGLQVLRFGLPDCAENV